MQMRRETFITNIKATSLVLSLLFSLSSCVTESASSNGTRRTSGDGVQNSPDSVNVNFGRLLRDNPIILSGNSNLSENTNMNTLLSVDQDFITSNQFLLESCIEGVSSCFQVQANSQSLSPLQSSTKKWAFDANSSSFLQVNTFGHMDRIIDKFHLGLTNSFNTVYNPPSSVPAYQSSIPSLLFTNNAHWNGNNTLIAHADCGLSGNAFFSPANFSICLGEDSTFPQVKFAQDSTVIYHEMGHAITKIMLNMRNLADPVSSGGLQADLGVLFYDEAGSIGEGIADYFSYYMNQRTHMGEWALGRFLDASRPLKEDDPIHAPGISTAVSQRLSYPQYVNYDPNVPTQIIEDVHVSGQIISHYLVALTEDIQSTCSLSKAQAINYVTHIMTEVFGELGDLTSRGHSQATNDTVNLNNQNSKTWLSTVNPINFRRFAQSMAKYLKIVGAQPGQCAYSDDKIEQLLDQYGLLLFKRYNENGNGLLGGHAGTSSAISLSNRIRSVLIPKDFLIFDPTPSAAQAFVFDSRQEMQDVLEGLQSSGQIGQITSQIPGDLPFNNGNARISPGEFVGIALNLYNDSNSTMAGVQVLANDWDHVDEVSKKPCNNITPDGFPSDSQGGTSGGDCATITTDNGASADKVAPICLVQVNDSGSTRWAQQGELRSQIGLDVNSCLSGASTDTDCFVRAVKGADHSFYSRIEAKQTWGQTQAGSGAPQFNFSNIVFFEVSPDIPPGTTFNCRFRTRFTNCDDCFSDSTNSDDDFLDFEYSGHEPFKVIDFQFTVVN